MLYLAFGSLILGASLVGLLAFSADNTGFFSAHFTVLVGVASAATLALVTLFVFQVYSLWRRIRAGVFGARLTARMFWIFGLMALLPGLVVYALSVQFLVNSIESWFDVRMEQALESGLSLGQSVLANQESELVKKAENVAQQLSEMPVEKQAFRLNDLRESNGIQEMALYDEAGGLLSFASSDKMTLTPPKPERAAIWKAKLQKPWSRTEQSADGHSLVVRVVVPVNLISLTETMRLQDRKSVV